MHDDPKVQEKTGRIIRPPAAQQLAPWQAEAIAAQIADAVRPIERRLAELEARLAALESTDPA